MTDEGVRLLSRLALVTILIVAAAGFRTLIGRNKRRGEIAAAGTVGGMALGVLLSGPVSRWVGVDVSAIAACIGIVIGWAISWHFARRVPADES